MQLPEKGRENVWGEVSAPIYMLWKYSSLWHEGTKVPVMAIPIQERDETGIIEQVPAETWAENGDYMLAVNHAPIVVALKPGSKPISCPSTIYLQNKGKDFNQF